MNSYKVIALLKDGSEMDLSNALESLKWEENDGELAQRATISLAQVNTEKGWLSSVMELCTTVYIFANGEECMRGIIWGWEYTSSSKRSFQITVYDKMIYLQKSKDNYYFEDGTTTKTVISQICSDWGIPLEYKWGNFKHGKLAIKSKTLAKMIMDTLDEVKRKMGYRYVAKYVKDTLVIDFPGTNEKVYIISSSNGTAIATQHRVSMDKLVTQVVVTGKDSSKGKIPVEGVVNGKKEYGVLRDIVSSSSTSVSEATDEANVMIKEKGQPENTIRVDAVDIPQIRKGDVVEVVAGSLNGDYFVLSVSHDATTQTMNLTLEQAVVAE